MWKKGKSAVKKSRSKIERLNSLEKVTDRNNIVDFRSTKIVLYHWELREKQEEIEIKNWNFRSLTFYRDSSIYIFVKYISSLRISNKEIRIIVSSNEKSRLHRGENVRKAHRSSIFIYRGRRFMPLCSETFHLPFLSLLHLNSVFSVNHDLNLTEHLI